jgi:ABC-2 type transport system ATP-binding protein
VALENSPTLTARGVSVRFGGFVALDSFDLSLQPGCAAALIGPNGAGKSTFLKVAAGLEAESSGSLNVLGERPKSATRTWKRHLGVLPEDASLFDALSLEEHCSLSGELYRLPRAETAQRCQELFSLLGIWEDRHRYAAAASFGMRKKTALALALLHNPRLLILDEPFEGLDPASCEIALAILQRSKASGASILFSSHLLHIVERLADEAILLERGRVSWRGAPRANGELQQSYLRSIAPAELTGLDWIASQ